MGTRRAPQRPPLTRIFTSLFSQRHFLRAPVPDFADPEIVFRPAVDGVHHAEFLGQLSGLSEFADKLSAELHLVDLAAIHALGIVRIRREQVLLRSAGDTDSLRCADIRDLRFEGALAIEDLYTFVAGIGHIDVASGVGCDPADLIELSLT